MYIEVTPEHVAELRSHGPGSALMWDGHGVMIATEHEGDRYDGTKKLLIGTYQALDDLAELRRESGNQADDAAIAYDLTDIGNDYLPAWRTHHNLDPLTAPIREALDRRGISYADEMITHDGDRLHQRFICPAADATVELGYDNATRTPVVVFVRHTDGREHAMTLNTDTPADGIAAIIGAAAGIPALV